MITDNVSCESEQHRPRRVGTVVAWIAILSSTGLTIALQASSRSLRATEQRGMSRMEKSVMMIESKYLVGIANWFGSGADMAVEHQLEQWKPKDIEQQLRVAVVAGDLQGPQAALERLSEALSGAEGEQAPPDSLPLLIQLYNDYSQQRMVAPSLEPAQRDQLVKELGWFGRLALSPKGSDTASRDQVLWEARRAVLAIGFASVAWLSGAFAGLLVLGYVVACLFAVGAGRFRADSRSGAVYAETFAIWLVTFLALSRIIAYLFRDQRTLSASFLVFIISGFAVFWPLARGVSWPKLCADIGWTKGRGVFRELLSGLGCYLMALPVVIASYIATYLLSRVFADSLLPKESPMHPIFERPEEAGAFPYLTIALIACVIAPLLEETMFRGFLYRHLREASSKMRTWLSIVTSSMIASAIFALIHPQGVLALPGIFGLAVAFSLTREWRDSLIAPMVGHSINNSVAVTALFFLMNQ